MSDENVGRYHRLYVNDWHHPEFRRLDDGARVVRLYVGAGPQTTSVGCFRLSTAVAVEDLGGTAESFEQRLQAVCEVFGWQWDGVSRVVFLTGWTEDHPPASPNVVRAWAKLIRNVPACAVRNQAVASIGKALKNHPASFQEPWVELQKHLPDSKTKPETNQVSQYLSSSVHQKKGNRRAARDGKDGSYEAHDDSVTRSNGATDRCQLEREEIARRINALRPS